jgi:teichuronic acid biosynthesis glycosyltransferase TuaC
MRRTLCAVPKLMKVLTFTSLYPNNIWRNHGIFIQERMVNFAKLDGCKVKVIAPIPYFPSIKLSWRWKHSQVLRQEVREGLEVFHPRYFMTPKVGMSFYGLKMFLSVFTAVKKIQKDFDFDVIDAHYVYPDGFAAVLLGKYLKKPVVISARGSDINLFAEFPLIRRFLQYTLRKAQGVIAVSHSLKEAALRLGIPEEKVTVIPNGVDIDKFYPVPKEQARTDLGLPLNKKIVLSVGHLTVNKGFDLVIKTLKILSNESHENNLWLVIVGEGSARKELERLISSLQLGERVRLVGAVPHQELYLWYSAADLFCLASEKEGWPNVLLESLACGTPVLATPAGGIPEILCSEEIGLLVKRNEQDIAQGISIALGKQWQPKKLVQYARDHTWDQVVLSVFQVFKSILHRKL